MHSWRRRASALAVFLVLAAPLARAQETTGTIVGTVFDQTGAVLPGAAAVVKNLGTGQVREFTTSESGRYVASLLSVGRYEVTFQLTGFKSSTAKGITLHVNDRLEINGTLGLGEVTDVVEVTAAAQMIQATPAVQNLMGPTQVQELPLNNRNFVLLATLVPGVSHDLDDEAGFGLTSRASLSINGARRNAVNWLVDGASNVDVGSNITLLATPTLESIEEFKIITSSYTAEWPRSGGGIINVVTKSGTNEYRGSAYEFLRNDALNANSYFRNQSTNPDIAGKPARLRYNNFGYTFGGPVMRDKLFFFWSQEWRRISRAPANVTANVPDPAWLTDPTSSNYVPPDQRDPNAVKLLSGWPQPNVGTNKYTSDQPNINNTRQEVLRLDYLLNPTWRLMARYTHDLSETEEAGGLFLGSRLPNVATTDTKVPGQVLVAQLTTTINPSLLNEFSFQFSGNEITTSNPEGTRNTKSAYGVSINEIYPQNNAGRMPSIGITGLDTLTASQLYEIKYRNYTVADNVMWQKGNHAVKFGGLFAFESKDENSANETQGRFSFTSGGGYSAFQNFLRGNASGACGTACTYTEAEVDVTNHLSFNRYELYVQDSWRPRPNITVDLGLRYSLFPAVTDKDNVLTTFSPSAYSAAAAPSFANSTGTLLTKGTGDPLNGIYVAGQNSPYGDAVYETDKDNIAPRLGFSWQPGGMSGKTMVRGGFGVYYDQPLVGIFEQSAFTNPPYNNSITVQNPTLANPGGGLTPGTTGVRNLIATSDPFETPRTLQWNIGFSRQLYRQGVVDVAYVGSRGDNLIRPVDINQPQPQDVVTKNSTNLARPYPGWGSINYRVTSAKARYSGLNVNFRHDGGVRGGIVNLAYTLSRNQVDATNDRDAVDLPQNPLDLEAEYAVARTDRTHIFTANYVYELPFFRDSKNALLRAVLGGWEISGITSISSGPPVSRIVTGNTNSGRRGLRVNQASDPFEGIPSDKYHINPGAYTVPQDGTYGDSGRAPFRLPGRNQWDLTLSKNWYPTAKTRLQFRADLINAFNHTQFTTIDNVCRGVSGGDSCAVAGSTFGQYDGVRLPREIQFGLKFFWN